MAQIAYMKILFWSGIGVRCKEMRLSRQRDQNSKNYSIIIQHCIFISMHFLIHFSIKLWREKKNGKIKREKGSCSTISGKAGKKTTNYLIVKNYYNEIFLDINRA